MNSELDGLTVDNGAESLAVLDSFLALSVQVPLFAADLNREHVALLESLDELFLVLKFAHLRDFYLPRAAHARRNSDILAVFVELNFAHSRGHHHGCLVSPVESESSSEGLRVETKVVHVVPDPNAHDTHAALEAEFLDFVGNEAAL